MSKSPPSQPPPEELSVEQARQLLRGVGLRCTSCRVAVLQYLSTVRTPQSHADVAEKLVPAGYDKTTVYRCLVEMASAGLCNRAELGDHVWRFELRRGHGHGAGEHAHFMCIDCGSVTCLDDVEVKIAPGKQPGVSLDDVTEVLLKGHCGCESR